MVHPCSAQGLSSWDQVSCYCERALNTDFWAEPLNAMSNLAFLFAAAFAYADLRARRPASGDAVVLALIGVLISVGAGSFLYHTYATVWSRLADVAPIAIFIALYMVLALVRFAGLGLWSASNVAVLIVGASVAMFLCDGLLPEDLCMFLTSSLNGSLSYAPALVSLIAIWALLRWRGHGGAGWMLAALCVFSLSLAFRTFDGWPAGAALGCMMRDMGGQAVAFGTHALWHVLNAVTLYLLLRALIDNPPATKTR